MKNISIITLFIVSFFGCATQPKNFTYYYTDEYTGLDQKIDIHGYYIAERACDSTFYSVFMFYPNGLFTIATTSVLSPELLDCFENGGKSNICQYPLWGTYRIEGDLIKTQVIREEGSTYTIFRDYRILPDKSILNVSESVEPQYIRLAYLANYPSFTSNPCEKKATFHALKTKRDSTECPYLKKKWFLEKK